MTETCITANRNAHQNIFSGPTTIWHLGQFGTAHVGGTIWHHSAKDGNLSPGQFGTAV